jgi:hypothetical protein
MLWYCSKRQRSKEKKARRAELYAIGELRREEKKGWRWRVIRFAQGIFGHGRETVTTGRVVIKPGDIVHLGPSEEAESLKFGRLRDVEEGRNATASPVLKSSSTLEQGDDRTRLLDSYRHPLASDSTKYHPRIATAERTYHDDVRSLSSDSSGRVSAPSIYSHMTGVPRKLPESRMPVRREEVDFSKYTGSRVGNSFR